MYRSLRNMEDVPMTLQWHSTTVFDHLPQIYKGVCKLAKTNSAAEIKNKCVPLSMRNIHSVKCLSTFPCVQAFVMFAVELHIFEPFQFLTIPP